MAPGNKAAVTFYLTAAPVGPPNCQADFRFGGRRRRGRRRRRCGEERRGERKKAKQTEPWHNLPSRSGAGEQREKVPPRGRGGDHRRAEMKQEARSNLFVVAGTRFFFLFLLSFPPPQLRLKGRNGGVEKMKRRNGTNTRRPSWREAGTSMAVVCGGAENKSNIVALVCRTMDASGNFLLCLMQKNKHTTGSAPSDMLSVMVITPTISRSFSSVFTFFPIAPLFSGNTQVSSTKGLCGKKKKKNCHGED